MSLFVDLFITGVILFFMKWKMKKYAKPYIFRIYIPILELNGTSPRIMLRLYRRISNLYIKFTILYYTILFTILYHLVYYTIPSWPNRLLTPSTTFRILLPLQFYLYHVLLSFRRCVDISGPVGVHTRKVILFFPVSPLTLWVMSNRKVLSRPSSVTTLQRPRKYTFSYYLHN